MRDLSSTRNNEPHILRLGAPLSAFHPEPEVRNAATPHHATPPRVLQTNTLRTANPAHRPTLAEPSIAHYREV